MDKFRAADLCQACHNLVEVSQFIVILRLLSFRHKQLFQDSPMILALLGCPACRVVVGPQFSVVFDQEEIRRRWKKKKSFLARKLRDKFSLVEFKGWKRSD